MSSTLNNLPVQGPFIQAYLDSPLSIKYTFPSSYNLGNLAVKLTRNGEILSIIPDVLITGSVLKITISTGDLKVLPYEFKLVIYNGWVGLITSSVRTSDSELFYSNSAKLILKTGERIKVEAVYDVYTGPLPTPTPTRTPTPTPTMTPTPFVSATPAVTPTSGSNSSFPYTIPFNLI